jgi:uncharacterized membrane protein HdeD (DUF308 family)
MLTMLSKAWWVYLVRGLLAILFGVLAFARPGLTLATLVIFFGAWALATGVFAIFAAFAAKKVHTDWWVLLLEGLLGIAVGLVTFWAPGITAISLLWYLAFWAILSGIFEIVTALRLRKEIRGEGWLMLAGLASIVFGVLLLARPGAGALAVITFIGAYALVLGVILLMAAFKLKGLQGRLVAA